MQLSSLSAENGARMQCAAVPPSEGSPPHHPPHPPPPSEGSPPSFSPVPSTSDDPFGRLRMTNLQVLGSRNAESKRSTACNTPTQLPPSHLCLGHSFAAATCDNSTPPAPHTPSRPPSQAVRRSTWTPLPVTSAGLSSTTVALCIACCPTLPTPTTAPFPTLMAAGT
jgi:hypothetical protein